MYLTTTKAYEQDIVYTISKYIIAHPENIVKCSLFSHFFVNYCKYSVDKPVDNSYFTL